jgi:anti-anti-sigma regulatory factor
MIQSPTPINKIRIRDFFSENISSRDAIALIFNRSFIPEQTVILDFSNVEFISRSAAHQLHVEIKRIEDFFNCNVVYVITNTEVSKLIEIVKKDINLSKVNSNEIKQIIFNTPDGLNEFLLRF